MKPLIHTSIAIKTLGCRIILENTQLFFLEQFLRKQIGPSILIQKMKVVDGIVLIDLKHDDQNHAIKKGIKLMCEYLEIFQRAALKTEKIELQVRLKSFPTFQATLSNPQRLNLSRD